MPRFALVRRVMIASPGDTEDLAKIAFETVSTWNQVRYLSVELLEAVDWHTSVYPSFSSGGPQEVINAQLVGSSDIVVGIFRGRLGTPTGRSASGTVEEIQLHIESGRPAMVYFSDESWEADGTEADPKERQRLEAFREWCQKNGVAGRFKSADELGRNLNNDLTKLVTRNPISAVQKIRECGNETPEQLVSIFLRERDDFQFGSLGLSNGEPELHCATFRPNFPSFSNPFQWWIPHEDFVVRDVGRLEKEQVLRHMEHPRDSFKFYLKVRKDDVAIRELTAMLVNGNGVVTGCDAHPEGDESVRIWFLHPEGFIHPYVARTYLSNHSIVDLSGL